MGFLRVVCPACDEQRFDALPIYTADGFSHARIDACDSCRVYLKTIDLTKDGLAEPAVDDLATLPPDLWARSVRWLATLVHAVAALLTIGGFIVHVYMGVAVVPGGLRAIVHGDVSEEWARHHHPLWLAGSQPAGRPPGDARLPPS